MINNDDYGGESVQKNAPAAPLDVSIGLVFHINLQPVIVLRRGLLFCRLHLRLQQTVADLACDEVAWEEGQPEREHRDKEHLRQILTDDRCFPDSN